MEPVSINAFSNFDAAVETVLNFLHKRLGFQLWMFTKVDGKDWIVLKALDQGYGVKAGEVFNWSDSFCSRMVQGLGPRIAPDSEKIAAYLEAPIAKIVDIKAYIGIPICDRDGSLFGTLCAIDPHSQPESLQDHHELIELQSKLLATILHYELRAQENAKRCEKAEAEAQIDILTGLYNRLGWEKLLAAEENRCKLFGQSASVVIIDLDNLKIVNDNQGHTRGDRLLQKTAQCLSRTIRKEDIIARLGGDEFGILMVNIDEAETAALASRIREKLRAAKIEASVGWAVRPRQGTFAIAIKKADYQMYEDKRQRKKEGEIQGKI